jgi:hypothetical protein
MFIPISATTRRLSVERVTDASPQLRKDHVILRNGLRGLEGITYQNRPPVFAILFEVLDVVRFAPLAISFQVVSLDNCHGP